MVFFEQGIHVRLTRLAKRYIVTGLCLVLLAVSLNVLAAGNRDGLTPSQPENVNLQLKWLHQFQFAGYYAAQLKGFYRAESLNVHILEGGQDKSPVNLVTAGAAQYGVSDSDILLSYLEGQPIVVIGAIFQHSPYVLLSLYDSNIRTPSDLIGKRIMVGRDQGVLQIKAMLKHEGVDMSQVQILPHSWNLNDLITHKVDAVSAYITAEPNFLRHRGVATATLDSADYGVDFYGDTLFTSRQEVAQHPERVAAFLRATQKGWVYALAHQEELADLILTMPGVRQRGITKAILLAEAKAMEPLILPDVIEVGHINPGRWRHIADELVSLGLVDKGYDLDQFIYMPPMPSSPAKGIRILLLAGLVLLAVLWIIKQRFSMRKHARQLDVEVERRQQVEVELERSQVELNEIFRTTAAGIAVVTPAGEFLLANPAFCAMLDYTAPDLHGVSLMTVMDVADRAHYATQVQALLQGTLNHVSLITQYIQKNGALIIVNASVSAVRDANQQVVKLIVVAEDVTEKQRTAEKLVRSEYLLKMASQLSQMGGWDIDVKSMHMTWSEEVSKMHDLPANVTPSFEQGLEMVAPAYRAQVTQMMQDCIHHAQAYDEVFPKITAKNRLIWVRSVAHPVCDEAGQVLRVEGAFQDITTYKNLQLLNDKQASILESIAAGEDLTKILIACLSLIEERFPQLICSVNFVDEDGKHMRSGASLRLPEAYVQAIDGFKIGKLAGSCGTAVYLQQEVIVSDIATDVRWKKFKKLALAHNLRACWSWPVASSQRQTLGTFAAYSQTIASPTAEQMTVLRAVAKTIGLAIEKQRAYEQIHLLESAIERLEDVVLITKAEPVNDIGHSVVYVNDAFERITGYRKTDILGKSPRLLQGPKTQATELERIRTALEKWESVRSELINYKKNGDPFWLELEITPIADASGQYKHWVSVERDITERKESELELKSLNRALRLISYCNDLLIRAENEQQLIHDVCQLAVEVGGYRMAWVGFAEDEAKPMVVPAGSYGDSDGFLAGLHFTWPSSATVPQDPIGKTFYSGKTVVIPDIAKDADYAAKTAAIARGYAGVVVLPLLDKTRCLGVLAMYASDVQGVQAEEIILLEKLAEDLCFGILNIRAKLEEQRIQQALARVASSVSTPTSNQFFEQLVQNIALATASDAAFISRILPKDSRRARTLAAFVDGQFVDNMEYNLDETPCRHLLETESFILSESTDCLEDFPTLMAMGMQEYIGQRLLSSRGDVIGVVNVLRRKPSKHNDFAMATLKIFATRAAAEIERQDYDRHISQQASLLDKAQDAIIVRDMDRRIQFWNKGAERLYGWTQQEALGAKIVDLVYTDTAEFETADQALLKLGEWSKEIVQRRKDGSEVFTDVHWTLVRDDKGQPLSVLCINTDVTQRRAAAQEIQFLAFYDALTELPNRLLLQDRLQHAIASSARSKKYGALLFIDMDNFKTINDTIGHAAGDELLKKIGHRFVENTRGSDTVARLGGDEFVILLEELSSNSEEAAIQSRDFAEKLLQVFKEPFDILHYKHYSTPSIGITIFQNDTCEVNDLLKQADLAMYQAKAAGRNTMVFYDPIMQTAVNYRAELEADLRAGLAKNEFLLHYQPQFDRDNTCIGAEALLRWEHSSKGMVSPAHFIGVAEETLLIVPIGQWVLKTACDTLKRWQQNPQLAHMTMAVNVSVNQFGQADFVETVMHVVEETGVDPRHLKLELTESLFVENMQDIIAKMTALKAIGITFSLDDFGTGYSSLNYIKRLPLQQLKIDQSFVRDIIIDGHDATICKSIISLARSLDLEVIAEGVETLAQREFLYAEGCFFYQGYYFAKPLPLDALESLLAQGSATIASDSLTG